MNHVKKPEGNLPGGACTVKQKRAGFENDGVGSAMLPALPGGTREEVMGTDVIIVVADDESVESAGIYGDAFHASRLGA